MKDSRLLRSLAKFCKFTRNEKDNLQFPEQQISYLGKTADTLIILPYGYHANIPEGALGLLFSVYGQEHNRSTIPTSPKERPKNLEPGELVIYHPLNGTKIHLKDNGDIDITAPNVNIIGNLSVSGDTTLADVTSNGKDIGDTHQHSGVESGGSNTGPVV